MEQIDQKRNLPLHDVFARAVRNDVKATQSAAALVPKSALTAALTARCGRKVREIRVQLGDSPVEALAWLLSHCGLDEKQVTSLACDVCRTISGADEGLVCWTHDLIRCAPCAKREGWGRCFACRVGLCRDCMRLVGGDRCSKCSAPLCVACTSSYPSDGDGEVYTCENCQT